MWPNEMERDDSITLTLHGLAVDHGMVRADVFLQKLRALLDSLEIADRILNGSKSHEVIITDLRMGNAMARLCEKPSRGKKTPASGSPLLQSALTAASHDDLQIDRFPIELIKSLAPLTEMDSRRVSHGEIGFAGNTVIRLDAHLARRTEQALARASGVPPDTQRPFEGVAIAVFDGVLREIDSRGGLVRGKLVLTAGGREVDCIFRRDDIPALREHFDRRARVEGMAHYDGSNLLPARLEVVRIEPIIADTEIGRWRGALANRRAARPKGI